MARARKGNVAKNSLKVASYGKQGSRKSNLMADFAKMKNEKEEPFKVLYLDPENGSIDGFALERLEEEGVNTEVPTIEKPSKNFRRLEIPFWRSLTR